MKRTKRILCMMAVVALLLSMTTAASAATLPFEDGAVSISVTTVEIFETSYAVDGALYMHIKGVTDTIPYSLAASEATRELDTTELNQDFQSYILTTYAREGFKRSVSVVANGSFTIPASTPNGAYAVVLSYTYGTATWNVIENSQRVDSGYIDEAPKSLSIFLELQ